MSAIEIMRAVPGDGRSGEPVLRRTDLLPLLVYVAFATALGWWVGQDANWDLRNYHSYNVFMWLSDRFERDVHVAGVQTFLNPVLDLPLYFATIKFNLPPIWFGLALSAIHGVLLFFVHRVTTLALAFADWPGAGGHPAGAHRRVHDHRGEVRAHGSLLAGTGGVIAAITSAYGAAFYAEIGATMGDAIVGLPILGSLALLMANAHASRAGALRASRRAGLAIGLVTGAKLIAATYVFGLLVAALIMPGTARARIQRALHFGLMVSLGFVLTSGFWMWLMYEHFGSPLFPLYNAVFASPLAPLENFNFSEVHHPKTWQVTIAFPFYFITEQMVASETFFRDGRLATALVSLATIGIVGGKRWLSERDSAPSVGEVRVRQLAAFFVVSYGVWLAVFAFYRYALPLEALSAAIIVSCGAYLTRDRIEGLLIALPICALLILSTKPLPYGRIPWTDSFFGISRDHFTQYQDAVVLLTDFPTAYVTPFFPQSTTFLRISSNWGLEPGNEMWRRLHERVAAAPADRLYWLEIAPYATQDEAESLLASFDLTLQQSSCDETKTNFDSLRICRINQRPAD